MNEKELNLFIKKYIENDKTKSAIMISSPWGTGKSFYIQNTLIPFIMKKTNFKCIVVSAYGLSTVDELSKSIYLEARIKAISKFNEAIHSGIVLGKTIVKGVSSFFGIDLSVSERDLKKIYKSINLSSKLLIIEDFERTDINIINFLGYVNNLTEHDGAKVIIVANEQEILKYNEIKNGNETTKELDNASKEYLRIKEKTIRDTIYYYPNVTNTLDSILKTFHQKGIDLMLKNKKHNDEGSNISNEILSEVISVDNTTKNNFRSIIFGIQKTIEIFDVADFEYDEDFFKSVLISNIAFSLKWKSDNSLRWTDSNNGSSLGTKKYPLEKIAYDYIINQTLNAEDLERANDYYLQKRYFESKNKEIQRHLGVIYDYYEEREEDVITSIKYLLNILKKEKLIPSTDYAKIGNYLISIKSVIGQDELINECLNIMVDNVGEESEDFVERTKFHSGIQLETKKAIEELNNFKERLIEKFRKCNSVELFDYSKEKLPEWLKLISKEKESFVENRSFAKTINNEKLVDLIKQCTSCEMAKIRQAFRSVYSAFNLKNHFQNDINSLNDLLIRLKSILDYTGFDKIQKMQIEYFISDVKMNIEVIKSNTL